MNSTLFILLFSGLLTLAAGCIIVYGLGVALMLIGVLLLFAALLHLIIQP
jgi:hypothetical protein